MKFLLILSAIVVVASGNSILLPEGPADYHRKYGIAAAEALRNAKEVDNPSRITGGEYAYVGQFPYQAGIAILLSSGWTSMCGASLLAHTKSLTAAHCWYDGWSQAEQFIMVYGDSRLFGTNGTRFPTSNVFMHPQWDMSTISNDIAMITHQFVTFNSVIQPIALPSDSERHLTFAGMHGFASGFGMTSNTPTPAGEQQLKWIQVPIMSHAQCVQVWGSYILNSTICTDGSGYKNICSGDSGGPLATILNGRSVLVGVVSFGAGDCVNNRAAGYARVTYYVDWILNLL